MSLQSLFDLAARLTNDSLVVLSMLIKQASCCLQMIWKQLPHLWISVNVSEEGPFVLRDKQYESKYNFNLATSIKTAQQRPRSLFAGYSIYRTPNVHTPQEVVTKLTKAAGGKVSILA